MKPMRPWLANSILLAVTAIWGATFPLTKNALAYIPVMPFLAVRFTIAALLLAMFTLIVRSKQPKYTKPTVGVGALLGLLLFLGYVLQTAGLRTVDPGTAGFLTGLSVVIVPILAIPMLHHTPPVRTWLGAGVAAVGLGLLCGVQLLGLHTGDFDVLLCALFYALQIILIDKYGRSAHSLALATVEIGTVAVLSIVFSLFTALHQVSLQAWLAPDVVSAILICAVPATAVAYFAQNVFQRYTSSSEATVIFAMEPVFAAVIAALMGVGGMSRLQMVGGLLIVISMLVSDPGTRWQFIGRRKRTVH